MVKKTLYFRSHSIVVELGDELNFVHICRHIWDTKKRRLEAELYIIRVQIIGKKFFITLLHVILCMIAMMYTRAATIQDKQMEEANQCINQMIV